MPKTLWTHRKVQLKHEHLYNALHGAELCQIRTEEFIKAAMFRFSEKGVIQDNESVSVSR